MERIAILIESSKVKDHADLEGARQDVQSYDSWLRSEFGGAWKSTEIITLSHPAKRDLVTKIATAKNYDYALVAFSGHGHHKVGNGLNDTSLLINDNEEILAKELNPNNDRSLIIVDACREITRVRMSITANALQYSLKEATEKLRPNRARCRARYQELIEQAGEGAIFLYSCSVTETAADENSFSRFLVKAGENWAEKSYPPADLAINKAFELASAATTANKSKQHPEMKSDRRHYYFPFGVYIA